MTAAALTPDNPRWGAAQEFARQLRLAMAKRRIRPFQLYKLTDGGWSYYQFGLWRTGGAIPSLDRASKLAEILEWPSLIDIVRDARTMVCARPACGRSYVTQVGRNRKYCSARCRQLVHDYDLRYTHASRKKCATDDELEHRALEFIAEQRVLHDELAEHRAGVLAMCRDCEPEGICRTPTCALRPISPLPLARFAQRSVDMRIRTATGRNSAAAHVSKLMTVRLGRWSPRRAIARRFGRRLERALQERKVSKRRLAIESGVGRTAIHWYITGEVLPRLDTARMLAEALDCDDLVEIVSQAREISCANPVCDKVITVEGSRREFCSDRCRKIVEKGRQPSRYRAANAERERDELRFAVRLMCVTCEPEGHCRQPDCPLRDVSPLPLQREPRRDVDLLAPTTLYDFRTGAGAAYATPEARAATLAGTLAGNARRWSRPGERERFGELSRQLDADGLIPTRGHGKNAGARR